MAIVVNDGPTTDPRTGYRRVKLVSIQYLQKTHTHKARKPICTESAVKSQSVNSYGIFLELHNQESSQKFGLGRFKRWFTWQPNVHIN